MSNEVTENGDAGYGGGEGGVEKTGWEGPLKARIGDFHLYNDSVNGTLKHAFSA